MAYTLFKLLAGGSYPTGVSADWRTQFASASIVTARPTLSGEIVFPGSGTTFGIYAAYSFVSDNPFDRTICIPEASVGAPVQVYMNGALVSEVSAAGIVNCSAIAGANVFEAVRSQSPLVIVPSGPFIDPLEVSGRWISLYAPGADPFVGGPVAAMASNSTF